MKIILWHQASDAVKKAALARPAQKDDTAVTKNVAQILQQVKVRGDQAVRDYSRQFDKVELADLRVSPEFLTSSLESINPKLRSAIEQAHSNITAFHKAEYPHNHDVETMPGVHCALHWRPLEVVGFYIPGGSAPLFSSVLMQVIPARIAGCRRMILCAPPQKDGTIHPAILATAKLCGVSEVFAIGGAQAIAAMAYGTETIRKVDKIFGPGNAYVTAAKQLVSQDPEGAAIDMPAGPSEVLVIAEKSARPEWVAADLLAQAEHDPTAQAILVTTEAAFAEKVQAEVMRQLSLLSRRSIAEQSIAESRIIVVTDMKTALEVSNAYAPEHLIIHNEDAARYLPDIHHAGSVFLGALTPESAGDYASGTNHVLPTYGYARAYNGINVLSYMKSMTVQSLTQVGLNNLGSTIITMAEAEGLTAHARAVSIRMEGLIKEKTQ